MDLIDPTQILSLLKIEPGSGLLQSFLLLMIWLSSRGVKKELVELKVSLNDHVRADDFRFSQLEKNK